MMPLGRVLEILWLKVSFNGVPSRVSISWLAWYFGGLLLGEATYASDTVDGYVPSFIHSGQSHM